MSSAAETLSAVKELFAKKEEHLPHKRSYVHFIPGMLELFLAGKFSLEASSAREDFSRTFVMILNRCKFYLSVIREEDMKERQRLERREFVFADALNKLALKYTEFDDEAFMQEIQICMENYINDSYEGA